MLHLDFETRSRVELSDQKSVGLDNYAKHPSTAALMLAWAIDEEPVNLWEIAKGDGIPSRLQKALGDSSMLLTAWNSGFERNIFKYKLGWDLPVSRWRDPQASARYLSLPAALEDVGRILGLPAEMLKDKDGERLIGIFSELTIPRKKRVKKGEVVLQQTPYFRDWNTDSEEWVKFGNYCKQDVVTEREIIRRLIAFGVFPLPPQEQRLWILDQKINDTGMPTARSFVIKSLKIAERAKQEALDRVKKATGLDNPNSNSQMLKWVQERGFEGNTLRKEPVALAIEDMTNGLTPEAREVLKARKVASSTSYKKLSAILRQLSDDDQLRNQFIFMGSSRAGRWSGNAVQLHNMARPASIFEDEENLDLARKLIYEDNYQGVVDNIGPLLVKTKECTDVFEAPLLTIKSCIRSAFEAPKGQRLSVADLNAIETRTSAWLAGCEPLLEVFRQKHDPYLDFAVKMTQIPYSVLDADYHGTDKERKAVAKRHRQIAKPGVLGCCYRLGPGGWGRNKYGDPVKTGLWGYAENMGVKMTLEQAQEIVRVYRESYKEIPQLWYAFEEAVKVVLNGGKKAVAFVGPNDCIKIDKLNRKDQLPIMRMHLPSGRCLHYIDARIEDTLMPWKKETVGADGTKIFEDVYKPTLIYAGVNQDTKQWESYVTSHGGKLTENAVQAIARDVLAEGMLRADEADFEIVGHVHDEIITKTYDDDFDPDHKQLENLMSQPMSWAPGLPLGADGYSGSYYHK